MWALTTVWNGECTGTIVGIFYCYNWQVTTSSESLHSVVMIIKCLDIIGNYYYDKDCKIDRD